MAIPEAYVVVQGIVPRFLDAIRTAGVPPRVTFEFLKTLGFKSSNDRSIITVLKAIGFLDSAGTPTERYRRFRDRHQGPRVLADALREAYSDIFLANTNAHTLSIDKLKGIIAAKTSKGDRVVSEIARTFQSLAKAADFSTAVDQEVTSTEVVAPVSPAPDIPPLTPPVVTPPRPPSSFHYNIEIHLPTTTDITVYNAIFKSLRESLLW